MSDEVTAVPAKGRKTKEEIAAHEAAQKLFREANHLLSFKGPWEVMDAINDAADPKTALAILMDVTDYWLKRGNRELVTWLMDKAPVDTWPAMVSLGLLTMAQPHDKPPVDGFDAYLTRGLSRWPDMSHLWRAPL